MVLRSSPSFALQPIVIAMHELLLFAQVPAALQTHVLQILAGLAAARPSPLLEQRLVFAPARAGGPVPRPAGAAPSDRYYLQLVGHLSSPREARPTTPSDAPANGDANYGESAAGIEGQERGEAEGAGSGWDASPWTLEFRDQPDVPGRRPATARPMTSVPVTAGDPVRFVEALGYA